MRKQLLVLPVLTLIAISSFGQTSVELIPSAGYTFASRTDFYDSYGRIDGGLNLGGSVKFNVNRNVGIEFLYSHLSTQSGLYNYGFNGGDKIAGGNLSLDYIMIGGVQSFGIPNSAVRPFIGGFLGAAVLTPGTSGYSNDTKFAVGLQLGTNIYMAPNLGLQLKAQLLSPVDAADGGFYFSNYGSGGGINTYSDIYQFSLSAGLIIGLGRILPEPVYHRPVRQPRSYRYYYY
ncbi:MAG: OmpA family protein [Bacteroidota bacterium]|nr:OmpA family protein [Bacteroidota bacterium]